MAMQHTSLTLTAPALQGSTPHSDAEILGSATWLWMHSPRHRELPVHALASLLLPAIKLQQFVLASAMMDGELRPVAFASWANFSAEAEARYMAHSARPLPPEDWRSGDRMWVLDWMAPFGHNHAFIEAWRQLMPRSCQRAFQHRQRGKVITIRGRGVSADEAARWWAERPPMATAT